jgi:drug/metabolite transporter (DMT)-like permease
VMDWMENPRERRARVVAIAAALTSSSWLIVLAVGVLVLVGERPRFWTTYVAIAGVAILLALAGRSVDRPYR